jgi:hypothetical protein
MVYLTRKNGGVVIHTDKQAMKELDGIETPDMEIPDAEFEAADCIARLVNGEIFIGKTNAEKQAEENWQKIITLKRKLSETDYVAAKIAEGSATKAEYAAIIAQRQAWRQEISILEV